MKTQNLSKDKQFSFEYELYPYVTHNPYCRFRYAKVIINKMNHSYEATLCVENNNFSLLHEHEDSDSDDEDYEDYDNEDMLQFFFYASNKKLKKCILEILDTFNNVVNCGSCNRIFHKNDLNSQKICLHCLLEFKIQDTSNECAICMDSECEKLQYFLPCKHSFHFTCITKLKRFVCPMCRQPFRLKK
jgi:hypothetical protein